MQTLQLKLTTSQQYEDYKNQDEVYIQGQLAERNGSIYITFEQVDKAMHVRIKNWVKIKKGVVSIKRSAAVETKMLFDEQTPYTTQYETPYGCLDLSIITQKIEYVLSETTFKLKIVYEMHMQGKKVSDNYYCLESMKEMK